MYVWRHEGREQEFVEKSCGEQQSCRGCSRRKVRIPLYCGAALALAEVEGFHFRWKERLEIINVPCFSEASSWKCGKIFSCGSYVAWIHGNSWTKLAKQVGELRALSHSPATSKSIICGNTSVAGGRGKGFSHSDFFQSGDLFPHKYPTFAGGNRLGSSATSFSGKTPLSL